MHAIVEHSELDASRGDEIVQLLKQRLLPNISRAPGFVSATFVRSPDGATGRSFIVFESEETAKAAATAGEQMPADAPVKLISLEVYEVVASA